MGKTLTVALNDYRQIVLSKTFLISIILIPLFFGIIGAVQIFLRDKIDLGDRHIAVVDRTGELLADIEERVEQRNRSERVFEGDPGEKKRQLAPRFIVERVEGAAEMTRRELERTLSKRVENDELYAFVIIGGGAVRDPGSEDRRIAYYSQSSTDLETPAEMSGIINEAARVHRFQQEDLDAELVQTLMASVATNRYSIAEEDEEGEIQDPEEKNEAVDMMLPMGALFLVYIVVISCMPILLNSVMEEKMQKIAELLVSAVSPFQLMMGKLVAGAMAGVTFTGIYALGIVGMLLLAPTDIAVPYHLLLWVIVFVILGLFTYGSVWVAIGAACKEMKDVQNFSALTVTIAIAPVLFSTPIIRDPDSAISVGLSLFPPFTPMLMLMRLAIDPGPPAWQVALSLALTLLFAILCVWAAGRVFRVGILAQGQTATFGRLLKWILSPER